MTLVSTLSSRHAPNQQPPPPSSSLPRFILRKRAVSNGEDDFEKELKLPTVTSAFLSGLFADVAQVQENCEEERIAGGVFSAPRNDPSGAAAASGASRPVKKSRVSLHRSMSRCGRSFKNLAAAASSSSYSTTKLPEAFGNTADSPSGVADLVADVLHECPLIPRLSKHDSLHFQLRCVGGGDDLVRPSSSDPYQTVFEAGALAFPDLPNAVSTSSCNTLTRNLSDLQTSFTETHDGKEAYGWFVAVDEDLADPKSIRRGRLGDSADPHRPMVHPHNGPSSAAAIVVATASDLAFVAPTAPHATNQDDEVEWAKAADMVDDVLGDFF